MSSDIWYREYLSVAAQLDTMTDERDKLRARLRSYPDDPAAVMSRAFIDDLGAHFEQLEASLAAADAQIKELDAEAEMLTAELAAEREKVAALVKVVSNIRPLGTTSLETRAEIDAVLKETGGE